MKSTRSFSEQIETLRNKLNEADAVIIGAGAGLSTSAGFVYYGERFHQHFSDFEVKYGFHDMYSGGFYPYETLEEHWRIGAGIFSLTVIWMRQSLFMIPCSSL